MLRRRLATRGQSTSNRWCPRPEILRMPLLTPKPRGFAHTLLTRPMSTRRIFSKRLRTGREVLRRKRRDNVCSQTTRLKAETVRPTVCKSSPGATLGRQSAVMHDDRMISLGRSSDDPNQDGLAKNPDPAQNLRSETSPRSLRRNDHFRFWRSGDMPPVEIEVGL
jgi:hypothetical protein